MRIVKGDELISELPKPAWLEGIGVQAHLTEVARNQFSTAEAYYRKAVESNPDNPIAYNNLGWTRQRQGDSLGAIACYEAALELNPNLRVARRNLATLLVRLGRQDETLELWHREILTDPKGFDWTQRLVAKALQSPDLKLAGEYAEVLAKLSWASPWYPQRTGGVLQAIPAQTRKTLLTISKLRHDIEQFCYLQRHGVLGEEFTTIIENYQRVIKRLARHGMDVRVPLNSTDRQTIGHVYNRIVHIRHTPRINRVFSGKWDTTLVENQYLNKPLGLVVVDDFLSNDALENVRRFCLESTVWSGNRYAHGRLGAFFHDGFNCPLLLQIAEELRKALPRIIIDRYPLRQLWGFKNTEHLPAGSTTHADFAAVNVNFWITPENANLDETSGGLIVYDIDAPLTWDFATYNGRANIINPFLQQQQARVITIPYRQNRAIIFNSDLFHASAAVRFRPGYENHRINITLLYGDRESDVHHPNLAGKDLMSGADIRLTEWRSAAFSRSRQRLSG
jgi:hypothetical protein